MGLVLLLYTYVIGGITFLPLLVIAFIYFSPKHVDEPPKDHLRAGEIEETANSGLATYKLGWITVTQEYLESTDAILSLTTSIAESQTNKSAYSSLYKLAKADGVVPEDAQIEAPSPEKVKPSQKKHRYYAVLKHGNLFFYKDETLKDVKHVVVLSNHIVQIWPKGLTDAQLFTKYTAIVIMKKLWLRNRRLSDQGLDFADSKITMLDVINPHTPLDPPAGSFFVYCNTNSEKEDWYFLLIRATKDADDVSPLSANVHAKTLHFDTDSMVGLISTLYSTEGQLHTKWLNAIIGRLFLLLQKTEKLTNYLRFKVEKKLNKIKTPGFLDKFQITKLEPGNSAPFITYPLLREISPSGDLLVSTYVQYSGGMSMQLATKINLNLGARFKSVEVDVLLLITLVKLSGPMLIKFKPPPSSRIWYSFEEEPVMSLKIEPIVSSRQLTYNLITNSIEKKFKEAIRDSLVLPHWDDLSFFDTSNELYRGGIWDKERPETQSVDTTVADDASVKSSSDLTPAKAPKKISTTLTDLSKRVRRSKTPTSDESLNDASSIKLAATTSLGGGTTPDSSLLNVKEYINKKPMTALKKIGKWYFKDEKAVEEPYTPPEMISSRRKNSPRKASVLSVVSRDQPPSYDFGRLSEKPRVDDDESDRGSIGQGSRKSARDRSFSLASLQSADTPKSRATSTFNFEPYVEDEVTEKHEVEAGEKAQDDGLSQEQSSFPSEEESLEEKTHTLDFSQKSIIDDLLSEKSTPVSDTSTSAAPAAANPVSECPPLKTTEPPVVPPRRPLPHIPDTPGLDRLLSTSGPNKPRHLPRKRPPTPTL